jgi:uncharacterized membrane protein
MTAVGFGSWPLISRYAGTNNAWTGFIVMGITALVSMVFYRAELSTIPSTQALGLLVFAGVANGIGMIAYTRLVTDQQFGMSSYAPAALVLMVVFITILGALLFKEVFTITKLLGLMLTCIGTWLLLK